MPKLLSDHTSNPLQASSDNSRNVRSSRKPNHAAPSSEDELGAWSYQQHVKQVVGVSEVVTPKPGQRRTAVAPLRFMVLDQERSDDELDGYNAEETTPTTIDPRRFGASENSSYAKEEDLAYDFEDAEGEEDNEYDLADYQAAGDEDMLDANGDDDELGLEGLSPLTPTSSAFSSPFSSPQSSRPPSPDESRTLFGRPEEEQLEIRHEIEALYKSVPQLRQQYTLVDRLGTGTFSSVYKAVDLSYDEWDNRPWLGNHPPESSAYYQSAGPGYKGRGGRGPRERSMTSTSTPTASNNSQTLDSNRDIDMDAPECDPEELLAETNLRRYLPKDGRVYVAIKRIYNTSSPDRIRNELAILKTCRDCRHVAQVITAYRNKDQVVIVLPYQRHMDFRDFFTQLHPEGVKSYLRCLLRALRDIHARGIIHRDVKPANFLYDPFTGIGTLCDFGLASGVETGGTTGHCLHNPATKECPHGFNIRRDDTSIQQIKIAQREARTKSNMPAEKVGYPKDDPRPLSKANRAGTRGFRSPEVLFKCQAQTGAVDIWSTGVIFLSFLSGKFPIFQSNDDIEALMEIVVIIGKKRAERTATLHGRTFSTNIPDLTPDGISWTDFVTRLNPDIMTPRKFDMRYYPHNMKHRDGRPTAVTTPTEPALDSAPVAPPTSSSPPLTASDSLNDDSHPSSSAAANIAESSNSPALSAYTSDRYLNPPSVERYTKDMANALDLLEQLLHTESTKRALPYEALRHHFLKEPGELDDNLFVPRLPTEGVCGSMHKVDEVTGEMWVEVYRKVEDVLSGGDGMGGESRTDGFVDLDEDEDDENVEGNGMSNAVEIIEDANGVQWAKDFIICMPGRGVAIGEKPCEFHRGPLYSFLEMVEAE